MKNKITIVCCYNDRKQYERLQASLAKQNTGYELIGMDNCHGQYASCSLALNAATARVETEYVIYAHQDVELPKEDTLARFAGYLAQTGEADLLGVAGIVPGAIPGRKKYFGEAEGIVLSGVQHGEGELAAAGEQAFSGMRACDSLDECFSAGTRHISKRIRSMKSCVITGICTAWSAVCIPDGTAGMSMSVTWR